VISRIICSLTFPGKYGVLCSWSPATPLCAGALDIHEEWEKVPLPYAPNMPVSVTEIATFHTSKVKEIGRGFANYCLVNARWQKRK